MDIQLPLSFVLSFMWICFFILELIVYAWILLTYFCTVELILVLWICNWDLVPVLQFVINELRLYNFYQFCDLRFTLNIGT